MMKSHASRNKTFTNDFLKNDLKDLYADQFISYIMQSSTMCSASAHTVKLRDKPKHAIVMQKLTLQIKYYHAAITFPQIDLP